MSVVGIELGQFISDPYGTGIQRVLQQLATHWPDDPDAIFVLPHGDGWFSLLDTPSAQTLLSIPFTEASDDDIRAAVAGAVETVRQRRDVETVRLGTLVSLFDSWLLPEVSYRSDVLERLSLFRSCMPVGMIGYDALPMTDPGNYRFPPGTGGDASEYFRLLRQADAVVCISPYAREVILDRLRRDRALTTVVALPGGDHVPLDASTHPVRTGPVRFLRLGTLEARKRPVEILDAFLRALAEGADAELLFVGRPNASSPEINARVAEAVASTPRVRWIPSATDAEVLDHIRGSDVFLSFGVEGFGIPVLEALRLGVPVLHGGIQPAAEAMEGRGATAVGAGDDVALAAVLAHYAHRGEAASLRAAVDAAAVPTWRDFVATIAQTMRALT